jgi:hypothetical protein
MVHVCVCSSWRVEHVCLLCIYKQEVLASAKIAAFSVAAGPCNVGSRRSSLGGRYLPMAPDPMPSQLESLAAGEMLSWCLICTFIHTSVITQAALKGPQSLQALTCAEMRAWPSPQF